MNQNEAQRLVRTKSWWYHQFEIFPGVFTNGVYDPSMTLNALSLPQDLTGATVLDVGAADGYFTKELTARGALVTAMDYCDKDYHGFAIMEKLQGKSFNFIKANLYEITDQPFAPFDYVICLGVLYHLPDMLRALWTLRSVVKGQLLLETLVSRKHEQEPIAEYLPGATKNNDYTNFWAPNVLCVESMLTDAGYAVERTQVFGERALFHARPSTEAYSTKKITVAYSFLKD